MIFFMFFRSHVFHLHTCRKTDVLVHLFIVCFVVFRFMVNVCCAGGCSVGQRRGSDGGARGWRGLRPVLRAGGAAGRVEAEAGSRREHQVQDRMQGVCCVLSSPCDTIGLQVRSPLVIERRGGPAVSQSRCVPCVCNYIPGIGY